ncbi:Ig-like domain from next BRCA1 [Rhizoctonia solani]|uniref:Ig-like domain from next BRCA1 n=1 Tax=Rhizoctonia solani TaxID=456999 RepID=A0A8H7IAH3_9AGAM|nr:Ig-like domain from next BRCA1 [Rhizoctonia solani]
MALNAFLQCLNTRPFALFPPSTSIPPILTVMERGGGSSRPNSFYSQASTSSCCSLADSRAEMRGLMDSFIADVQRIRETFDPSAVPDGRAASPVRNDDVETAPPVPGAYQVRPSSLPSNHMNIKCNSCMTTKDIQSTHATCRTLSKLSTTPNPSLLLNLFASAFQVAALCRNAFALSYLRPLGCEGCYTSGFPVFDHSPVHRFMHIEHPVRVITAPAMMVSDTIHPLTGGCTHEGPRYKCENCDDVDLCTACLGPVERATIQHAAWHTEKRSDKPVRLVPYNKDAKPQTPKSTTLPLAVHHAECDACDETIVGIRHKCTICHDFDLCDVCFKANVEPMNHKSDHDMLHLERPQRIITHVVGSGRGPATVPVATSSTSTATPNALHNAWCDACSERIRGIRHKCLDCDDFDFCNACVGTDHFNGDHTFYALTEPGQVVVRNIPEEPTPPRTSPGQRTDNSAAYSGTSSTPYLTTLSSSSTSRAPGSACAFGSLRYVFVTCFRVSEEVHPGHSFAKVYQQGDIVVRKSSQTGFRHHARCDVCQKQITGTRYKVPLRGHAACCSPETHAFVKLKSHIASYDGLKNVFAFAAGRQTSQPQTPSLQVPTPKVRIPTPGSQIPPSHNAGLSAYTEPMAGAEVFHTAATPSPIVPLSTLGCTIVPHTTIVPSLPQSPEPLCASPQAVSIPAIPSPIPSPPPIPGSSLTPERKLTASWAAASGCQAGRAHDTPLGHVQTFAPQMTLVNARPVSLPDVPVHEPTVIQSPSRATTPEVSAHPLLQPVALVAQPESSVVSLEASPDIRPEDSVSVVSDLVSVVELVPEVVTCASVASESDTSSEVDTASEPEIVAKPETVVETEVEAEPVTPVADPEIPGLLPVYPHPLRAGLPDMIPLVSSPSSTMSSASIVSYTSPFEAAFIEDRTIVDGQIVSGGAEFSKIWRMRNTGTVAWPKDTTISFVGGHNMSTQVHWLVGGDLSPGQDIDVEVDMKAPEEPGRYNGTWSLKTPRARRLAPSEVSASSIIVPTRAPGMSVATMSTTPASPAVESVSSTIRSSSVTDMADDDDVSIGTDDSDDLIWDEVRRRGQGTSPH